MTRFFRLKLLAALFLAGSFGAVFSGKTWAEEPTCDQNFETQMEARAWMGSSRDTEAAQTLIKGGKDAPTVTSLNKMMNSAWTDAKCKNISDSTFHTFKELAGQDYRPACGKSRELWSAAYEGTAPPYTKKQSPDSVLTYFSEDCSAMKPVKTGVRLSGDKEDATCMGSCSYNPVADKCVKGPAP